MIHLRSCLIACALCLPLQAKEITFFLIRHGETDWNLEGRIQGQSNVPLNDRGKEQARALAEYLYVNHADLNSIYSSDLSRASQTALYTADLFKMPTYYFEGLREGYTGVSEGMLIKEKRRLYKAAWDALIASYPDKRELWNHTPVEGEETFNEIINRFTQSLLTIAMEANDKDKVAVFSHGKAIMSFIASTQDVDISTAGRIDNCSGIVVGYNDEKRPVFTVKSKL